jgi:hypothetical protein
MASINNGERTIQQAEIDEDDVVIDDYSCFDLDNTPKNDQQTPFKSYRHRFKASSETDYEDNIYENNLKTKDFEKADSKTSIFDETRPPIPPVLSSSSLSSTSSSSNASSPTSSNPPVSINLFSSSYSGNDALAKSKRSYVKQNSPSTPVVARDHQVKSNYLAKAISTPSIIDRMNQENVVKNMVEMINENGLKKSKFKKTLITNFFI